MENIENIERQIIENIEEILDRQQKIQRRYWIENRKYRGDIRQIIENIEEILVENRKYRGDIRQITENIGEILDR